MLHRSSDLVLVVIITMLGMGLLLMGPSYVVLRAILALPLVLILPGYALTAAMFPRRTLGVQERLLFCLGLSLVVAVLGGLAIDWTPRGMALDTWAVFLCTVILGASALALVRRGKNPQLAAVRSRAQLNGREGLLLLLAAMVASASIGIARTAALQQQFQGFTQFWLLSTGEVGNDAVRLGVHNIEVSSMQYAIQVEASGGVVGYWPSVALESNEQWETTMLLPRDQFNPVEAMLFRSDSPGVVYRRVVLWRSDK